MLTLIKEKSNRSLIINYYHDYFVGHWGLRDQLLFFRLGVVEGFCCDNDTRK